MARPPGRKTTPTPFLVALALSVCGCWSASPSEVVVYTALDREFSEPIFLDFEQASGVDVQPKFDVESTKTVGLVNAIVQEENRPRCDVFWNNEILHTLRLEKLGLLQPYKLPQAEKFPANYRSPEGLWYGFAARARVLIVNKDKLADSGERPDSLHDLTDPNWKDQCGLAMPLFGTTATHAAVLFAHWGEEEAKEYFQRVKENAQVLSGNKQVALAVSSGQLAFGMTDTDDAIVEIEKGMPVEIVYPDQGEGELGTLFIPNTLCVIQGAPHPEAAGRLLDYLLTPEVERRLSEGASAQFPLHADVEEKPRVSTAPVRWMDVDFHAAADAWDAASTYLREEFAAAE
ncbi:MAG: extracellular solute-binding protein [Planctomycetes bacterium]|nr:extracellular solute-binding protein [Planctomycetota bacterium]